MKAKPLSPHLGIYKPQISSVLSIMHRASGIFNFIACMALTWAVIMGTLSTNCHHCIITFFHSGVGVLFLMAWSYSLCFHLCTGIRHLFWDMGFGFQLKAMTSSGLFSLTMSLCIWLLVWAFVTKII